MGIESIVVSPIGMPTRSSVLPLIAVMVFSFGGGFSCKKRPDPVPRYPGMYSPLPKKELPESTVYGGVIQTPDSFEQVYDFYKKHLVTRPGMDISDPGRLSTAVFSNGNFKGMDDGQPIGVGPIDPGQRAETVSIIGAVSER